MGKIDELFYFGGWMFKNYGGVESDPVMQPQCSKLIRRYEGGAFCAPLVYR